MVVVYVPGANAQNDAYIKLLEFDNRKSIRTEIGIQVQASGKVNDTGLPDDLKDTEQDVISVLQTCHGTPINIVNDICMFFL